MEVFAVSLKANLSSVTIQLFVISLYRDIQAPMT